MKEIKMYCGDTIDDAVKRLIDAKNNGEMAFCDFNGVKLYSYNVTMDSAYRQITGKTKKQFDEMVENLIADNKRQLEKDRKKAIKDIPHYEQEGEALIFPHKKEKWKEFVKLSAEGDYSGLITKDVLEIMHAIEEGKSVDEIYQIFLEQGHSGRTAALTRNMVMLFSKNGYPFFEKTHLSKWTLSECYELKRTIQENIDASETVTDKINNEKNKNAIDAKIKSLKNNRQQ